MEHRDFEGLSSFRPVHRDSVDGPAIGEPPLELKSNENPLGPSPKAVEAVIDTTRSMHRYPAQPHARLDGKLADRWEVTPEQIWLGAGAVSVIDMFTRALLEPGECVLRPDPGFSYFGRSTLAHYGRERTYPLHREDDFAFDPDAVLDAYAGEPLIYLNTPHNPTGQTVSHADIVAVLQGTGEETLIVVDEAYGPFVDEPSAVALLEGTDRVAVIRTFSKAYGLAGVRLGYAIVPTSIATAYGHISTPFGVSSLACHAGLAALDDETHLERTVAIARSGRQYMHDHLEMRTWPSEANFVLAAVDDATAATAALADVGVRVRDCTPFGLDDCIRITVGTPEQTRRAVTIINEVLG